MNHPRGHLADTKAQEELRRHQAVMAEQDRRDLVELMRHEWGRRFLYRVVYGFCLVDAEIFAQSGQEFARNEGKRKVGITLANLAKEHCPEMWVEAVREQTIASAQFLAAQKDTIEQSRRRSAE